MFGSFPAVFRNKNMAIKASKAFGGEEGKTWGVMVKFDGINEKGWYKPCRTEDYKEGLKSTWFVTNGL